MKISYRHPGTGDWVQLVDDVQNVKIEQDYVAVQVFPRAGMLVVQVDPSGFDWHDRLRLDEVSASTAQVRVIVEAPSQRPGGL